MDANQRTWANPYGLDEDCQNCPALCETRTHVVHGYGDVGADFLFIGERPSNQADAVGVPFAHEDESETTPDSTEADGTTLRRLLERLGLCDATSPPDRPSLQNAYLTNLTRCRDSDRLPTDEEIARCEPYLNAEIRMINPEVLIPIGERALEEIGTEYTTTSVDELSLPDVHGETIRGRGFALVPMLDPGTQTDAQTQTWLEQFVELMASDYRQTKGRRER